VLIVDAIVLFLDDVPDQKVLVRVDKFSHVSVLPSEATDIADRKVLDDWEEYLVRECGE
jgi:hypothetical protein